ncbi:MAG: hypothetical protein R8P61_33390 [Bacteroidia bacterium]|nr:hypothetical protein [Bacteroidia bacterium]
MLKVNLSFKTLFAFLVLMLLLGEAHELAHIFTGYGFCGCWGERDFNVWGLCEGCRDANPWAIIATFMGPIFTFSLIWLGRYFLLTGEADKRSLGFVLIFANIPFARILTAAMGGGDEVYGLRVIFENENNFTLIWMIGLALVLAAAIPPLITAWKSLAPKGRIWYFLAFFLLPMFLAFGIILIGLNGLLEQGVLADSLIWGTPLLITIHTFIVAVLVALSFRWNYQMARPL